MPRSKVVEKDDLIWIGSASTSDDAIHLIRAYRLKAPGYFLVYSEKTKHRSFYIAGGDGAPEVVQPRLNFRSLLPVQTVDATPSGIKLFSKVVFMKPGKRFGLSAEQKIEVWRRWKAGQTLHEIGRAFGKEHSSIRCLVARHGGIAPGVRRRALLVDPLRPPR